MMPRGQRRNLGADAEQLGHKVIDMGGKVGQQLAFLLGLGTGQPGGLQRLDQLGRQRDQKGGIEFEKSSAAVKAGPGQAMSKSKCHNGPVVAALALGYKGGMTTQTPKNAPAVLLPPPVLFGGALGLGIALDWLLGWHLPMPLFARSLLSFILCGLGAIPAGSALAALRAAKTAIPTWKPVTALVTSGPYRYSRNPIYIGLILIYLGLVILLGSGTGLALLLPVVALLHFGVVLREEVFLKKKFGAAYQSYAESTPRWMQ